MKKRQFGVALQAAVYFCYAARSALLVRRSLGVFALCLKVRPYKHLKKLVSVDVTDKVSCVIVCGYVGGILGEDIAYYLINWVVALLHESIVNNGEIFLEFRFLVFVHGKRHSFVEHIISLLLGIITSVEAYYYYTIKMRPLQEHRINFPDLTVNGCWICLCSPMEYVRHVPRGDVSAGSVAAASALDEAVAVGTLGNCGVLLVSADGNAVERAVVLGHHIVLTLRYGTLDTVVLMLVIHFTSHLNIE